jgi:hypothetical protein
VSARAPLLGLALLLAARAAAAQAPALPPRLGAPARAAIERLADSLRAEGVPSDPLYAKAAEGVLKGADDARIVQAARRLARELADAHAALGPGARADEVVAAASALHAGLPPAALQRLRDARGRRASLALTYVVAADLATRGVPAAAVAASLDALLARGAADAELTAFRTGVERDLGAGRDAQSALGARTQHALQQLERVGRP